MKFNLIFALIALLFFLFIPIVLFWVYFLPQKWQAKISRIPAKIWCKSLLTGFGIKLHYYEETPLKTKPLIIFTNHQSSMDASIIMCFFGCGFITKYSLAIPFFGWNQKLLGSISLKRSSIASFCRVKLKCEQRLKQKIPLCIFPEGTRGNGKKLAPFKRGLIDFYYHHQVATLILAHYGSHLILPSNKTFPVLGKKIVVYNCGFVYPKNYSSLELFIKACHQRMVAGLEEAKVLYNKPLNFAK